MDLQDEALRLETGVVYPKIDKPSTIRNKYLLLCLQKAMVVLLSASLFSILLSFFTGLSFLNSCTCYFSTFLVPLLTQAFERKYMFLLCNGIVVFLARKSGFYNPSEDHQGAEIEDLQEEKVVPDQGILHSREAARHLCKNEAETYVRTVGSSTYTIPSVELMREREQENELLQKERQEVFQEEHGEVQEAAEEDEDDDEAWAAEDPTTVVKGDQAEDQTYIKEFGNECSELIIERYGENDTESEGHPSNTEELNKKIEEFIRKMKAELQLEAQQQQVIAA